jgi:Ca2+-binding EF-hand superfamily protein
MIDQDSDGWITEADLKTMLTSLGELFGVFYWRGNEPTKKETHVNLIRTLKIESGGNAQDKRRHRSY